MVPEERDSQFFFGKERLSVFENACLRSMIVKWSKLDMGWRLHPGALEGNLTATNEGYVVDWASTILMENNEEHHKGRQEEPLRS